MSKYPLLTSPIKIGSKAFKHRMVAAPIYCGPFALMPFFSDVLFNGIVTRAEGGCAEVIVGETAVDFEHANREPFPPVDYSVHSGPTFDRLKEIADRYGREYTTITTAHGRALKNVQNILDKK